MDIKLIKSKNIIALLICFCISVISFDIDNAYYYYKEFLNWDFYNSYPLEGFLEHISDNSVYTVVGDNASEEMLNKRKQSRGYISENTLAQIFVKNNNSDDVYSNDIFDFNEYMETVKSYAFVCEIDYKRNTMYLLEGDERIRISTRNYGNIAQNKKENVTTYIAIPDKKTIKGMKAINDYEPLYLSYEEYRSNYRYTVGFIGAKIIAGITLLSYLGLYIYKNKDNNRKLLLKNILNTAAIVGIGFIFSFILSMQYMGGYVYVSINTAIIFLVYYFASLLLQYKKEGVLYEKLPILEDLHEIKAKNIDSSGISRERLGAIVMVLANPILFITYLMISMSPYHYLDYLYIIIIVALIVVNIKLIRVILNKINNIEKIKAGISEIKKGNLDYEIKIKKDSIFDDMVTGINEIGETINIAVEDRLKSERMKNELITNVSHDLKTPLTAMINYISLMKKEDIHPAYIKDYVQVLDKRSQRLRILIEDLFEASKIRSNNIELDLEENDINQLLTQTLVEMEEYIEESKLDFVINVPQDEVHILADGKKTYRVFENIVCNILKYSLAKTRVYVDLEEKDDKVYISFKNISKYQLNFDPNEITERFTRGDLSRNTDGSGLGLAIAKGFVEAQGGELKVDIIGDLFIVNIEFNLIKR